MDCYIKEIILFGGNNERRNVSFKKGLNIITGASQTGKSALIEISDYCLCSKFSSIPRGKIYDWTDLYCLVFESNSEYLIIGRKSFDSGGNLNAYCKIESKEFELDKLTIAYFNNMSSQKLDSVRKLIGDFFGLTVKNTNQTFHTKKMEGNTASIRNMTSFFFQHQNLIASKHTLFSRFDDPYRKKETINQLPVFLGWVGDQYYAYIREKEILTERKDKLEKLIDKEEKVIEKHKEELNSHFKNYYSIIGKTYVPASSIEEILLLRKTLPDYNEKTFINETLSSRFIKLKETRDKLKNGRDQIQKRITNIEISEKFTSEYQLHLLELKDKSTKGARIKANDDLNCPVCGKDNTGEVIEELKLLHGAREDLKKELLKTKDFKNDYSSELQKLRIEKEKYNSSLTSVNAQLKDLEKQFKEIEGYKSTSDRAIYAKAKLDFIIENITNSSVLYDYKEELKKIEEELNELIKNLSLQGIESKLNTAQNSLNSSINKLCDKLDFEERFKPINSKFNIRDFSFSFFDSKTNSNIRLSELGSGSNWLATHLAVFMSFLELFSVEKTSNMPSILLLDQPSQIYFPNEPTEKDKSERNKEFEKVDNIYNVILDKINEIKALSGYEPQVIVTDHADYLNLKNGYNFEDYVIKRWWSDSVEKALI